MRLTIKSRLLLLDDNIFENMIKVEITIQTMKYS